MTLTWVDNLLTGMQAFFVANESVKRLIASRLYEVAAEQWMVMLESLQVEKSPRLGRWASYQVLGSPAFSNLSAQSTFRRLDVQVACYGLFPRDCRQVFSEFYGALNTGSHAKTGENRFYGTWGSGDEEVDVEAVRFDTSTLLHDWDDTFRQSVLSCTLIIHAPNG